MSDVFVKKTIVFVKETLKNASSCHDWWHIYRVWNLAKYIAKSENVNILVVELASLLHDIADPKFHDGDEKIGPLTAEKFLTSIGVDRDIVQHVTKIVENVSFGKFGDRNFFSKELGVVQDADRLDAIGAIGIARTFTYGGYKNRQIHDPDIKPIIYKTKEDYRKNNSTTINHFYEKLLTLKDKMNTKTGLSIAKKRHKYMEKYLAQFYKERNLQS